MIRVLVRASSPIAKAGLESLLRAHPGWELAAEPRHSDGRRSVESPDTILVAEAETFADPTAREGMEWARLGAPVMLLVRSPAAESIAAALRSGVRAVLPSAAPATEITGALEAVAAGLVVLDSAALEAVLPALASSATQTRGELVEALTPREVEVLRLVAAGLGNKEIGARLGISDHTVKFHVASLMGKLGASSRTEAVTLGIRHGLVMI